MKYAIYDKAADGYLTKMEFEVGYSENTQFECGYNEYITEAQLLDTPKEAADAIVRIESFKFMDKGRFVMHSFDDTLKDQYIISEAGKPTKVVDNITVNIDGIIDVKYGTMASHWSASSLEYAIDRMNALQKAKDSRYTAWCNTFDIYKVINVIDEKSSTHYQFIKVTNKGLTEYAKDEVDPLNKRIEELEKANYDLGQQSFARGLQADRLKEENDDLKTKVEAIKKEASNWKNRYKTALRDCEILTNVIDDIYDDLGSTDICKGLKETCDYIKSLTELNYIKVHHDNTSDGAPIYISAMTAFKYIVDQMIVIMASLELNQSVAFASADEVEKARNVAYDIIAICKADDKFEVTLKKKVEDFVDEIYEWKSKAQKAEKALGDQKKLNDANKATIARMVVIKSTADKRIKELRNTRGSMAEVIFAIRNAICNNNNDAFRCINDRMLYDSVFNSDTFMAGVRENILDICDAYKKNITNHELKNSEIAKAANALEEVNDKNEGLMADILSGKKIPISKDKYDAILTSLKLIDLSYEGMYGTMIHISPKPKPTWLPGLLSELKDLTE